jgi:DNA transformation protein
MADGFVELVKELFQSLGPVSARRMFGGHGIYLDGAFVAIVWRDQLYLKADVETRGRFEALGLTPFSPSAAAGYSLAFYSPPTEALEDPDEFRLWAELALAAARRALKTRRAKRRP